MKCKLIAAAVAGTLAAGPALADLVIPDLSYRTGPYAAGGTPFSDGVVLRWIESVIGI